MSFSETVYQVLIRAYPESFRSHHEEDLKQWFREQPGQHSPSGRPDRPVSILAADRGRSAQKRSNRTPAFFLLAVATLAIGVGFATTIFSVIDGVILAPLPYVESAKIVRDVFDLEQRNHSFAALAVSTNFRTTLRGRGEPELFSVSMVSAEFFAALGARPFLGRSFTPAEDQPGANPVVILGHGLWQRRWGGDPAILGETITLGQTPFTVVGILPSDFLPPEAIGQRNTEIWIPLSLIQHGLSQAGVPELYFSFDQKPRGGYMDIVARTAAADAGMLTAMRASLREVRPDLPVRRSVRMEDFVAGSIAAPRFYTLVLGTFASVALLLALVGIYGTLAYAVSQRRHEIGVRLALGASAPLILAMVLRRGMALVVFGVALGLAGALPTTRALESLVFGVTPTDATTLTLGVATVLMAALVACAVPAWRATKLDPVTILRDE